MVWEALDEDRGEYISAAHRYREEYSDLLVPGSHVTRDGIHLGVWIKRQRIRRNAGRLSAERIAELDALGMVWAVHDVKWQQAVVAAEAFRAREGHLLVPHKFTAANGIRLGSWIHRQRSERRNNTLAPDRIAQLDALEMFWSQAEV